MSLTTTNPPTSALSLIQEAVSALSTNQPQSKTAAGEFLANTENLEAATPVEVYSMGLTDVIEAKLDNSSSTGWRYLLLQDNLPVASADVTAKNENNEVGFSHFNRGRFVEGMANAIIQAENLDEVAERDYEMRILNIPAVYVMAVWLHGATDDIIIPMAPTFEYLEAGKSYSPETFFTQLKETAVYKMNFDNSPQA